MVTSDRMQVPTPNYVYERSVRSEMLPFVPEGSQSLLDVGCGYGVVGSVLKAQRPDVEVWGMDSAPRGATARRGGAARVGGDPQSSTPFAT